MISSSTKGAIAALSALSLPSLASLPSESFLQNESSAHQSKLLFSQQLNDLPELSRSIRFLLEARARIDYKKQPSFDDNIVAPFFRKKDGNRVVSVLRGLIENRTIKPYVRSGAFTLLDRYYPDASRITQIATVRASSKNSEFYYDSVAGLIQKNDSTGKEEAKKILVRQKTHGGLDDEGYALFNVLTNAKSAEADKFILSVGEDCSLPSKLRSEVIGFLYNSQDEIRPELKDRVLAVTREGLATPGFANKTLLFRMASYFDLKEALVQLATASEFETVNIRSILLRLDEKARPILETALKEKTYPRLLQAQIAGSVAHFGNPRPLADLVSIFRTTYSDSTAFFEAASDINSADSVYRTLKPFFPLLSLDYLEEPSHLRFVATCAGAGDPEAQAMVLDLVIKKIIAPAEDKFFSLPVTEALGRMLTCHENYRILSDAFLRAANTNQKYKSKLLAYRALLPLCEKHDIRGVTRFSPAQLRRLLRQLEAPVSPRKRVALIGYPRGDYNNAWDNVSDVNFLLARGYRVKIFEAENPIDYLKKARGLQSKNSVYLVKIAGHGTVHDIQIGVGRDRASLLTDKDGEFFEKIGELLGKDGWLVLSSCSNGGQGIEADDTAGSILSTARKRLTIRKGHVVAGRGNTFGAPRFTFGTDNAIQKVSIESSFGTIAK